MGTGHKIDYLRTLGINVINRHAFELTSEAGTPKQVSQYKIVQSLTRILQAGRTKITRAILAAETGLSLDYIKKLVAGLGGIKAFKKWVLSLYNSYRSSTRFSTPDFLLQESKIREWMGLDRAGLTLEVLKALNNYGWRDFQEYLDRFSIDIQAEIWATSATTGFARVCVRLGCK